jgi:hypothetical protein
MIRHIEIDESDLDLLLETLEMREIKETAVAASMRASHYEKVSSESKMNGHLNKALLLRELQTKISYAFI